MQHDGTERANILAHCSALRLWGYLSQMNKVFCLFLSPCHFNSELFYQTHSWNPGVRFYNIRNLQYLPLTGNFPLKSLVEEKTVIIELGKSQFRYTRWLWIIILSSFRFFIIAKIFMIFFTTKIFYHVIFP